MLIRALHYRHVHTFQVRLEAVRGATYYGDIAVDDVSFSSSGQCICKFFCFVMEVITWALLSGKKCSEITKQNLFANLNHKASIESEEKLQADETSYWHFILSLA